MTGERLLLKLAVWFLFFLALYCLAGKFYVVIQKEVYPSVHLVMETVSIVVAVCASLMSLYEYKYKHEAGMLILSLTFCAVALTDFAHTISYFGMPDFITANSPNKASTYWIIARILQGTGLMATVFADHRVKIIRWPVLHLVISGLASLALIFAVVIYLPFLPAMYDPAAERQTAVKIYLEYLIIAVLGLSTARLLLKKEIKKQDFYLCTALITGIFGEVAFTLYSNAYDTYNLLGHIFKVISFSFIFKGLSNEVVAALYENNRILEKQRKMLADTNRRLEEADRLKDEFLANTSHELRTPLTAVIAFTELLLDKNTGQLNELQIDYLNEINDSSRELLGRINDILDLSKISRRRILAGMPLLRLATTTN